MAWYKDNPKMWLFIILLILIIGCVAGIVAPAIIVDNTSKIAPILIFSVILFFVLAYIFYKVDSSVRKTIFGIIYLGGLLAAMVLIGVADIDEGTQIATIIFLSLLFLISIVVGISYSGPNGEKYISGVMYIILLGVLIASIVIIWTDTVDVGTVKVLTLICLGVILLLSLILGFISYKNKTFGKFNFLGLNPKIQIDKIKSYGINKYVAGVILLTLIVTVVMLYIGGAQFIDVYKNTTSKSDFDKNFALIWAILNFVVAVWITLQTFYFIVALGMMYYDDYKKQCYEKVKADIDENTGLPTGTLKTILEDEFELAYRTTDSTKEGYIGDITQSGKINSDGIFIPARFLDEDGYNVKDDAGTRLALEAYLANHRKNVTDGNPVIIPSDTDVRKLIDFTIRELKSGGVPDDIISELRRKLDEIGGQSIRYQTAEANEARARTAEARTAQLAEEARTAQLAAEAERERADLRARAAQLAEIAESERAYIATERERAERRRRVDAEIVAARAEEAAARAEEARAAARAEEAVAAAEARAAASEAEAAIRTANEREARAAANEAAAVAAAEAAIGTANEREARAVAEEARALVVSTRAATAIAEARRRRARLIEKEQRERATRAATIRAAAVIRAELERATSERDNALSRITELQDNLTANRDQINELNIRLANTVGIDEANRLTAEIRSLTENNIRVENSLGLLRTDYRRAQGLIADQTRIAEEAENLAGNATEAAVTLTTRLTEAERRLTEAERRTAEAERERAEAERERAEAAETIATTERERAEAAVAAALRIETEINPLRERIDDINFNSTQYITDTVNRIYSNTRLTDIQKQSVLSAILLPFINRFNPDDAVIRVGISAAGTAGTRLTSTLKKELITIFLRRGGAGGT